MSFAFHALGDESFAPSSVRRLFSTVGVLLLAGIVVVVAGHINMGWAGNELLGP